MKAGYALLIAACLSLMFSTTSVAAASFRVAIGDDCDSPSGALHGCFSPTPLAIDVGDSVTFYPYADPFSTGPHNVVADDGSFRCAFGCDGEGGSGTPGDYTTHWMFTRTFNTPMVVNYHDEVSLAAGVIVVRGPFTIGPGITGAWYNPGQSGHGLFIEILPDARFYASWFAFNPAGTQQAWFSGVGTYSGNAAIITSVQQPTGGRWIPNFDPAQIVRNAWGTLIFTFTDCDHGKVDFNSVGGYGTGSMNLVRLTQPAGLSCP